MQLYMPPQSMETSREKSEIYTRN